MHKDDRFHMINPELPVIRGKIGIVVIGRNEGERLIRCLKSLEAIDVPVVYVDSGSNDGSLIAASNSGAEIVQLDRGVGFSAGRARNAGLAFLRERLNDIEYVQFIDGDCEICAGWIEHAAAYLQSCQECVVAAGRVKEKFPEKTIYNRLCDIEWNTPIGEVKSCGGIFMIRAKAFEEVGGFNPEVIAGEEPELCYRLRWKGWKIHRVDHFMVFHDASIQKFSQWWKRAIRSGHAYAHAFWLYGAEKEKLRLKDNARIWGWALFFPAFIILMSAVNNLWWLSLWLVYLLHWLRISMRIHHSLPSWQLSFIYAFFTILSQWPQLYGQTIFFYKRLSKGSHAIIEYK